VNDLLLFIASHLPAAAVGAFATWLILSSKHRRDWERWQRYQDLVEMRRNEASRRVYAALGRK
jgi:ferric-dicitrate binding protein FerR (iron transport regulator)